MARLENAMKVEVKMEHQKVPYVAKINEKIQIEMKNENEK